MITNMVGQGSVQGKPAPAEDITERLKKLKSLFEAALITEAEYAAKKEELLKLL